MFCRFCGLLIPDDSIFCMRCGQRISESSYVVQQPTPVVQQIPMAQTTPVAQQPSVDQQVVSQNTVELHDIYCSYRIEKKNALKKLNLLGTEKGYFSINGDDLHFTRIPVVAQTLVGAVGGAAAGAAGALAAGAIGSTFRGKSFLTITKGQIIGFSVETLFKTNYLIIRFEGKEIAMTCKNPAFDMLYNWLSR